LLALQPVVLCARRSLYDATLPVPISSFAAAATQAPRPQAKTGRRCCSGWRNPQQWLMLAMFLLALFIFSVRLHQSQQVRVAQRAAKTLFWRS
jgi:hypothetical protein